MSGDFYSIELLIKERVGSKYQEADAHRLANTITRYSPVHQSAGRALKEVTRAVGAVMHRRSQPSPVPR